MRLGIDCSNIRGGGGLTIVLEFVRLYEPFKNGFASLTIWCNTEVGEVIRKANSAVNVEALAELDSTMIRRFFWRLFRFPDMARAKADLLLIPGGLPVVRGIRNVSISLNLLPFIPMEYRRDRSIKRDVVYRVLRIVNRRSLVEADGTVFLNENARDVIFGERFYDRPYTICPLGVDSRFFYADREIRSNASITEKAPFRLLYVSTVNGYKHQWNVVDAVADLRQEGIPVEIDFVGGAAYPRAEKRLRDAIARRGGVNSGCRYLGKLPYDELHRTYRAAEGFVFASTCENMPNICLEAMASALPIASSYREPMRSLLKGCAVFFDAEAPESIANAIRELILDEFLRNRLSEMALEEAKRYTWTSFYDCCISFCQTMSRS